MYVVYRLRLSYSHYATEQHFNMVLGIKVLEDFDGLPPVVCSKHVLEPTVEFRSDWEGIEQRYVHFRETT